MIIGKVEGADQDHLEEDPDLIVVQIHEKEEMMETVEIEIIEEMGSTEMILEEETTEDLGTGKTVGINKMLTTINHLEVKAIVEIEIDKG